MTTTPMQVTAIAPWFGGKRPLDPLVRYGDASAPPRARSVRGVRLSTMCKVVMAGLPLVDRGVRM